MLSRSSADLNSAAQAAAGDGVTRASSSEINTDDSHTFLTEALPTVQLYNRYGLLDCLVSLGVTAAGYSLFGDVGGTACWGLGTMTSAASSLASIFSDKKDDKAANITSACTSLLSLGAAAYGHFGLGHSMATSAMWAVLADHAAGRVATAFTARGSRGEAPSGKAEEPDENT